MRRTATVPLDPLGLRWNAYIYLSQMVLFLNGNSGLCNWARLSTKDQLQNALMNSQSKYRTFCSKGVQADGFAAQRESVKDDTTKVVIQVYFAENFTTKTQIEIQSAYWAYNQVTFSAACAWEQGGTHPGLDIGLVGPVARGASRFENLLAPQKTCWPGGPVDLKTYWPPKKLTGPPKN